jgi:hypothetical protein
MAMHTAMVNLPAQTTLDQAIVALLKLRRRDVPGDATLEQTAILRFAYVRHEASTGRDVTARDPEDIAFPPKAEDPDEAGLGHDGH